MSRIYDYHYDRRGFHDNLELVPEFKNLEPQEETDIKKYLPKTITKRLKADIAYMFSCDFIFHSQRGLYTKRNQEEADPIDENEDLFVGPHIDIDHFVGGGEKFYIPNSYIKLYFGNGRQGGALWVVYKEKTWQVFFSPFERIQGFVLREDGAIIVRGLSKFFVVK